MQRREFLKSSGAVVAGATTFSLTGCRDNNQEDVGQSHLTETTPSTPPSSVGKMPDYSQEGVFLITDTTPKQDHLRFPAEWERHESTIMAMPPIQNWVGFGFTAKEVRQQWADVANTLADFEHVMMIVQPEDRKLAAKLLSKEIQLISLPLNDGWTRDTAPIFLLNKVGKRWAVGPTFNGWGEKMDGMYHKDAMLKVRLCSYLNISMYPIDVCMEGGAVALDGDGTLITTEQCLLNKNRNPTLTKETVEKRLKDGFCANQVIWLGDGLKPDPITDGHIDGMLAFVSSGRVLLSHTDDKSDPNFKTCEDARKRLSKTTDAQGREIDIVDLPLTPDGGHMNFYIANDCVLVPTTDDPRQDDAPLAIIGEQFPNREVIGISGRVLAEGGGGIHCITQQVPAESD